MNCACAELLSLTDLQGALEKKQPLRKKILYISNCSTF